MLYIFDMGGVVTSTFDYGQVFSRLGITKEKFFEICKNGESDIWDDLEKGFIGNDIFWEIFCERSSLKIEFDYFRFLFHPELNVDTVKIISELKQNNRVICGTNTIQSHYEIHIERGDYSFFNNTYASNKIHLVKPTPDFFLKILQAENVSPSETFFVDDKIENCNAAESVGIKSYCFDNASGLRNMINTIEKG